MSMKFVYVFEVIKPTLYLPNRLTFALNQISTPELELPRGINLILYYVTPSGAEKRF